MEPVVLIVCEVCGKGCKEGESATYDHDGKESLIQSRSGGFICKECWAKFEQFVSSVTLCGDDEYELPPGSRSARPQEIGLVRKMLLLCIAVEAQKKGMELTTEKLGMMLDEVMEGLEVFIIPEPDDTELPTEGDESPCPRCGEPRSIESDHADYPTTYLFCYNCNAVYKMMATKPSDDEKEP